MSRFRRKIRLSFEDAEAACKLVMEGQNAFMEELVWASRMLVPNRPMDIVDWAKANMVVPTVTSPERSGPLVFNAIQAAIIRLTQDTFLKQVAFKKPPRFGSTLMSVAIILYFAFHEGRSIIYYERSEEAAQKLHDAFLLPIIENSPELRAMMRPKTKSGVQDSWSDIVLTNGAIIQLRSASNNGHFRSIKGNPVLADEISSKEWRDRTKNSEGSKLRLMWARLQQSAAPMLYTGSTPTKLGECVISDEYEKSDQRVWKMPCPRCPDEIIFEATISKVASRSVKLGPGMRYTVGAHNRVDDVWYECACGGHIEEIEKEEMVEAGRFVPTNLLGKPGHAGVWVWAAYSSDPQSTWPLLAEAHQTAVNNPILEMMGYTNLTLALAYNPVPMTIADPTSLQSRRQSWKQPDGSKADAPQFTEIVDAGVDIQRGWATDSKRPPRWELTFLGTGRHRQRAVLDHVIISHVERIDPLTNKVERIAVEPFSTTSQGMLWEALDRVFVTQDGRRLRVRRAFVDVSWNTDAAVKFCHLPQSKALKIIPIRGSSIERNGGRVNMLPDQRRLPRGRQKGNRYLTIGTQTTKDAVSKYLRIPAGYPDSIVFADHLDDDYYKGLVAEFPDEIRPGVWQWTRISETNSGEPWDCLVYAIAAERYEINENGGNNALAELIDRLDDAAIDASVDAEAEIQEKAEAARLAAKDGNTAPPPKPDQPPAPGSMEEAAVLFAAALQTVATPVQPAEEKRGVQMRVVKRGMRQEDVDLADDRNKKSTDRVNRVRDRAARTGVKW